MNNDVQLDDLKQFIESQLSQTEGHIRGDLQRVEKKVDDGFAGVGDAIEQTNQRLDEQIKETGERLTHLEHRAA